MDLLIYKGEKANAECSGQNELSQSRRIAKLELCHSDHQIYRSAEKKVKERLYMKYIKVNLERQLKDGTYEGDQLLIEAYKHSCKVDKPSSYLVTVSLQSVDEVKALMAFNKKWIDQSKSYYVFEQRGNSEETIGQGPHIHYCLKCKSTKKKSEVIREMASTFKVSKNYVDVRPITSDNVNKYLLDIKPTKEKQDKQLYDVIWRERLNLRKYYGVRPDAELASESDAASKSVQHSN